MDLKERRETNLENFARKTVKNEKYEHWFPKNPLERITRNTPIYKEEKAIGNRL